MEKRIVRGGSWLNDSENCRSAVRIWGDPGARFNSLGFRLVCDGAEDMQLIEDLGADITLELVQIPGGSFLMGSPYLETGRYPDESPQHEATVPAFAMGKFEVTQAQYEAVMGNNPSNFKGANRPVESVSWNDAVEFCQKLSQQSGRTYRLPSEAEWEYACRAGTTTPYFFGESLAKSQANYGSESTTDVGSFPPNNFGLYDMHGNVYEWCLDDWHDNYSGAPTDGSAWTNGGDSNGRILRGGSWYFDSEDCRSAFRAWDDPGDRVNDVGFRVVCEPGGL